MRNTVMILAALAAAAPAAAQSGGHAHGDHGTHGALTNGGKVASGWHARRDRMNAGQGLEALSFVATGPQSFHATMGSTNAIFWNPNQVAKGEFQLGATFTQNKLNGSHPEGYGLVFNGANLDQPNQSYVYFLVRDGKYLINHRAGEEVHKLVTWTEHPAIRKAAADGTTSNHLSVRVIGSELQYIVNGQVVHTQDANYVKPDGIVGVRVNMHLDMKIEDFKTLPSKG